MNSTRSSPERQSLRELLGLKETGENSSPNTDFRPAALGKPQDEWTPPVQSSEAADSNVLDLSLSMLLSVRHHPLDSSTCRF